VHSRVTRLRAFARRTTGTLGASAGFRLRFAQASGRENQKFFYSEGNDVFTSTATEESKVFLLLFFQKKQFFLAYTNGHK
jgi:hypothetical protein